VITPRTASTNGALCLRRRRLGSRYAAKWYEVGCGNDLICIRRHGPRTIGAKNDGRPARGHRDAAGNCDRLAGLWRALLGRQLVMGTDVGSHRCHARRGSAVARMILTRCVDCPHCEVERADPAHDSNKTTHGESHILRDYNYEAAEDAARAICPSAARSVSSFSGTHPRPSAQSSEATRDR